MPASPLLPMAGPCEPWCTAYDVRSKAPFDDVSIYSVADVELAREAASGLMFQAAGRRWPGRCLDTVRPDVCAGFGSFMPAPLRGDLVGWVPASAHGRGFCCSGHQGLYLGSYPLISVDEVRVDGDVLAESAYELRDWAYVVRIDGDAWPCCTRYEDEVPRLEVDFTFGALPPAEGKMAATAVARQLLLAWCDTGDCQLGGRAQSITRENVTIELQPLTNTDPAAVYEQIPEVMAFLGAHNPNKLRRRARFLGGFGQSVFRNTTPAP